MDIKTIDIDNICLDLENPRHERYESEQEAIRYLCQSEKTSVLAKDIVDSGLNPLELFAVIPEGAGDIYTAAEGNRRLCALKLLRDPDIAPPTRKADFRRLADQWGSPITTVSAVVFQTRNDVRLWLSRIHGGEDAGRGRIAWNSEQKTRFTGAAKNAVAQLLLDVAESKGYITADQRRRKLSTVQRYSSNRTMRDEALWLTIEDGVLKTTRREDDFFALLKEFVTDVAMNKINTRANKPKIDQYANHLRGRCAVSEDEVAAWSIVDGQPEAKEDPPSRRTRRPIRIAYSAGLDGSLKATGNYKIQELYRSLCTISAREHTPLLAVGVWAFVETLTSLHGRNDQTSFPSYLSAGRLGQLGFGDRSKTKEMRDALQRLSDMGNATKHHPKAAAFNDRMLINDFGIAQDVFVALAKGVPASE